MGVIADGGMRANCNWASCGTRHSLVIADGGMRANCNGIRSRAGVAAVIADGGMRANCNTGIVLYLWLML